MTAPPPTSYTLALLHALPVELTAATLLLTARYPPPTYLHPNDKNTYQLGRLHSHNVILTCLPTGRYGTVSAAVVASTITLSFPNIKYFLLVGVGGGIPSSSHDVRLGDVVVSKPDGRLGGVVQYDLGKTVAGGGFERIGDLNKPPQGLLTAVATVQADVERDAATRVEAYLEEVFEKHPDLKGEYGYQGVQNDVLYAAGYDHPSDPSTDTDCSSCSPAEILPRAPRGSTVPKIHYGIVASGNQVIKHGITRDQIVRDVPNALCFEMEAAGLMDHFPCIVIRGVCDYADSHKNKRWQGYAALTAAAYAKVLVGVVPSSTHADTTNRIFDIPRILHRHFSGRREYLDQIQTIFHRTCHTKEGTIISVYGTPGVGKSQICLKYVTDHKDEYDCAFYATGSTPEQWFTSCDNIVNALELPERNHEDRTRRTQALKRWFSTAEKWVLVVDDVASATVGVMRNTLPLHLGGHVLLSTRDGYIAREFSDEENCIALREMDADEGRELVLKIYNQQPDESNAELAEKISGELGGLPLALEQATTCGSIRRWGLKDLFENLKGDRRMAVIHDLLQDDYNHHADIVTTLGIALKELEPAFVAVLNLMLMMRPQGLPVEILRDGASGLVSLVGEKVSNGGEEEGEGRRRWGQRLKDRLRGRKGHSRSPSGANMDDAAEQTHDRSYIFTSMREVLQSRFGLDRALVTMEKSSLIRRGDSGGIWVHDLVREVLRGRLEDWERRDFLLYAEQISVAAMPDPLSHSNLGTCRGFLPHTMEVCGLVKKHGLMNDNTAILMREIGRYFKIIGRYDDAMEWCRQAFEYRKKIFGEVSISTAGMSHDMGLILSEGGAHEEALGRYKRLIEVLEELEGKGVETGKLAKLEVFSNIAGEFQQLGRNDEAQKWYKRTISGLLELEPSKERDSMMCRVINNTGRVFDLQGDQDKALEYYERAKQGFERGLSSGDLSAAYPMQSMAIIYAQQGNSAKAVEYCQKALDVRRRILGDEHPTTLNNVGAMGWIYKRKGNNEKALEWFERAEGGYVRVLGMSHPDTIRAMAEVRGLRDLLKAEGGREIIT